MRMVCNACETRHCEYKTNKPISTKWTIYCPLINPEEGPVPAEWRESKNRGE